MNEEVIEWPDISKMSEKEVREELLEARQRFEVMEKDFSKQTAECRKLKAQIKQLQELQAAQGLTTNNTSSTFTLPSEFKKLWDQLLTEQIQDAMPDFLGDYRKITILTQQLFRDVRELLLETKRTKIAQIALILFKDNCATTDLEQRLQLVFKDQSQAIFQFTDEQIQSFLQEKYRHKCLPLFNESDDDLDLFEDSIKTPDFKLFTLAVIQLQLHMVLSEPPIEMQLQATVEPGDEFTRFEFWMFNKTEYYCIDGFPKEGLPCVVVMPPPYRQGYVYQGIKPAVIVIPNNECTDAIKEHVRVKQEALLEKIKAKRSSSIVAPSVEEKTNLVKNLEQVELVNQSAAEKTSRSRRNSSNSIPRHGVVEIDLPVPVYSTRKAQLTTEYIRESPVKELPIPIMDCFDRENVSLRTFDTHKQASISTIQQTQCLTPQSTGFNHSLTNNGERFAAKQMIEQSLRYKREERSTSANARKPPLATDRSQASIIAEMHFQQGMKDIKQDLQKKISSYQTLLKKTYGEKKQQIKPITEPQQQPKTTMNKNDVACRPVVTKPYVQPPSYTSSNLDKQTSKIETLEQLKSAYFQKIQSLNQKLEHDRALHRQQLEEGRSRSKSPVNAKNMPRQIQTRWSAAGFSYQNSSVANTVQSQKSATAHLQSSQSSSSSRGSSSLNYHNDIAAFNDNTAQLMKQASHYLQKSNSQLTSNKTVTRMQANLQNMGSHHQSTTSNKSQNQALLTSSTTQFMYTQKQPVKNTAGYYLNPDTSPNANHPHAQQPKTSSLRHQVVPLSYQPLKSTRVSKQINNYM